MSATLSDRPRSQLICALRLARRELRGGIAGFRVFLACLVLGVGAIAATGSLGSAVEAGIRGDARTLLGGDVSARLAYRPASEAERQFLAASGTLTDDTTRPLSNSTTDGTRLRSMVTPSGPTTGSTSSSTPVFLVSKPPGVLGPTTGRLMLLVVTPPEVPPLMSGM